MQLKIKAAYLLILMLVNLMLQAQQGGSSNNKPGSRDSSEESQDSTNMPQKNPSTNSPSMSLTSRVVEVFNSKYPDSTNPKHTQASIGDIIVVRAENLEPVIRQAQCDGLTGCSPQKICLFINGQLIRNIFPISGAPRKLDNSNLWELRFQLDRNEENDGIWATILGSPPLFSRGHFFIEPVSVSIGLQNGYAIPTISDNTTNFRFERIHRYWFWGCLIGEIFLLALIGYLINRGLLRDRVVDLNNTGIMPPVNGFPVINRAQAPFSLARSQMAFWFILIIISFLFIWLITDAYNILSASVLALIGLSAGTSLTATVIDNNKRETLIKRTIELQQQLANPTIPLTTVEQAQKNAEIQANILELGPHPTDGFFNDILEDANGMSFHRLQMLIWTLVLGMLFVYTVWKRLSMPDFDAALLALTGITAGTYLGFKFPEKQT